MNKLINEKDRRGSGGCEDCLQREAGRVNSCHRVAQRARATKCTVWLPRMLFQPKGTVWVSSNQSVAITVDSFGVILSLRSF